MYPFLLGVTAVVILVALLLAYRRTGDSLHPLVLICPMFLAMYVLLPVKLLYDEDFGFFLTNSQLVFAQTVTVCGVFSFCLGCLMASWKKTPNPPVAFPVSRSVREKLFIAALVLGTLGVLGYLVGIFNVGGFWEAYGKAYGGGLVESGYVREASSLCLPAIAFIFVSRVGRRLSVIDLAAIFVFALPFVIQGILGARRGPTFLIVVTVGVGWYLMRNKRPAILLVLSAGVVVGLLLLLLATNRNSIFLGSDWNLETSPLDYTRAGTGNEYIYGAGTIVHFSMTGDFYWGRRYFAIVFIRPIPKQFWPDKYKDVGIPQIEENLASGVEELAETVGWVGAMGSAGGMISDMWIEFSWWSMLPLFLIGAFHGYAWRRSCVKGRFATVVYVLTAALTLFLISQALEAMIYRFLYMCVPAWLIWQWVKAVPLKERWLRYSLLARERMLAPIAEADQVSRGL
jgi:oligosaccharide repeat unit polymerase